MTEYRYCGSNPNNYVTFNEEVAGWRIIGLVNTPEGSRIKLIRANPLNEEKAWDDNKVNDWSNATLQQYFNGKYLNNLNEEKSMIDTITWNLGGYSTASEVTTTQYYNYERGTIVFNSNPKLWQGKIALMHLSDYGYATSGGSTINRKKCLEISLNEWNSTNSSTQNQTDCTYNDWLLNKDNWQFTLMPYSSNNSNSFTISTAGFVFTYGGYVYRVNAVTPVLYLKTDVKLAGGTGNIEDPYILAQENS